MVSCLQVTLLREHAQGPNQMMWVLPTGGFDPVKHGDSREAGARAELSEEAHLTGGEMVQLTPAQHPGIVEGKWCANRFTPFLALNPQVSTAELRAAATCLLAHECTYCWGAVRQQCPQQCNLLTDSWVISDPMRPRSAIPSRSDGVLQGSMVSIEGGLHASVRGLDFGFESQFSHADGRLQHFFNCCIAAWSQNWLVSSVMHASSTAAWSLPLSNAAGRAVS